MYEEFIDIQAINAEAEYSGVYRYLDKYRTGGAGEIPLYNAKVKKDKTIWVLWMQGMENAPELVRCCFASLNKFRPQGYEIILLTAQNLQNYIVLPDFIMDKYHRGLISNTHFSDLVRMELLYVYGGLWVDATVYVCSQIPEFMYTGEFFAFDNCTVTASSVIKMSTWWIFACAGNCIISKARRMLYAYWEQENQLNNYFLLHIVISKVIDEDNMARSLFYSKYYYSNGNPHFLQNCLAMEYSEKKWNYIKYISPIQKLSYKKNYLLGDIDSFYVALITDRLY